MAIAALHRGVIFRAEHDDSYPFWGDNEPPRSKLCLVFNADPVQEGDVHYFLATSKVDRYRESPSILSDVLILPPASYPFFPRETLIDFRRLCVVSIEKLVTKRLTLRGVLSDEDIRRCEDVAAKARILDNRHKRLLRLR
ncbi:MAG TPA: hypothetical protein VNN25_27885 [Thermoanaerobaculia bacterium]|nr:hypothetical protein [Thermoanaerobaculia bacterium]